MSDQQNDNNKIDQKEKQEELYFDGEKYYTREEFFNPPDDDIEPDPPTNKKWLKVTIASVIIIAMLSNVLALWPRLFNFASIEFLAISRELSQNEDVQLYKESVVVVRSGNSKGTGFYISEEGHIITNHHVVDSGLRPTVTFQEGDSYTADIIESDPEIDIAILQIDTKENVYPVLEFDDDWEPDLPIYVIGNPLFFNFIANKGNILGLTPARDVPMLMIDAPIYKGNSGSPVINEDGNVVGVVFATSTVDYEGSRLRVGLAVPVDYFKEYIEFQ
ncbi:trypsin-like peptidase domain-containing protein [Evansella sp. AB-rgal1]|uniref:S1 family peptidase n=1 Tax=Evansella sp. AB-rgal1 TaxID=3242696 RepID=UPI00359DBBF0